MGGVVCAVSGVPQLTCSFFFCLLLPAASSSTSDPAAASSSSSSEEDLRGILTAFGTHPVVNTTDLDLLVVVGDVTEGSARVLLELVTRADASPAARVRVAERLSDAAAAAAVEAAAAAGKGKGGRTGKRKAGVNKRRRTKDEAAAAAAAAAAPHSAPSASHAATPSARPQRKRTLLGASSRGVLGRVLHYFGWGAVAPTPVAEASPAPTPPPETESASGGTSPPPPLQKTAASLDSSIAPLVVPRTSRVVRVSLTRSEVAAGGDGGGGATVLVRTLDLILTTGCPTVLTLEGLRDGARHRGEVAVRTWGAGGDPVAEREATPFSDRAFSFVTSSGDAGGSPSRGVEVNYVSCNRWYEDGSGGFFPVLSATHPRATLNVHLGDQVYADSVQKALDEVHGNGGGNGLYTHAEYFAAFRRIYVQTWSCHGMSLILRSAANVMLPDDHDIFSNLNARVWGSERVNGARRRRIVKAGIHAFYVYQVQLGRAIPDEVQRLLNRCVVTCPDRTIRLLLDHVPAYFYKRLGSHHVVGLDLRLESLRHAISRGAAEASDAQTGTRQPEGEAAEAEAATAAAGDDEGDGSAEDWDSGHGGDAVDSEDESDSDGDADGDSVEDEDATAAEVHTAQIAAASVLGGGRQEHFLKKVLASIEQQAAAAGGWERGGSTENVVDKVVVATSVPLLAHSEYSTLVAEHWEGERYPPHPDTARSADDVLTTLFAFVKRHRRGAPARRERASAPARGVELALVAGDLHHYQDGTICERGDRGGGSRGDGAGPDGGDRQDVCLRQIITSGLTAGSTVAAGLPWSPHLLLFTIFNAYFTAAETRTKVYVPALSSFHFGRNALRVSTNRTHDGMVFTPLLDRPCPAGASGASSGNRLCAQLEAAGLRGVSSADLAKVIFDNVPGIVLSCVLGLPSVVGILLLLLK